MVADLNSTRAYKTCKATGALDRSGRPQVTIGFPPYLFKQIATEAIRRGWSFRRMVVHLCEASIEGIE